MNVHTRTLTAGQSLALTPSDLVLQISVLVAASSSATVLGTLPVGGTAGSAIALSENQGFSISSALPNSPISGLTVTCVSGTVDIMLAVQ